MAISNRLTLHLLPPFHSRVQLSEYLCPFTIETLDFAKMMSRLGHTIKLYGHPDSDVKDFPNCEIVPCIDDATLKQAYPDQDWDIDTPRFGYADFASRTYNDNVIRQLPKRLNKNDLVLSFYGLGHKVIYHAIKGDLADSGAFYIEPVVGYPECIQDNRIYASSGKYHLDRGRRLAAVETEKILKPYITYRAFEKMDIGEYDYTSAINPHFFDPDLFVCDNPTPPIAEPYCIYMGRIIKAKGIHEAIDATKQAGVKLVIAGSDKIGITKNLPPHCEFVGALNPKKRAYYLTHALAIICWSHVPETFNHVHIQSMLCRRPAITSAQGAFAETMRSGYNGYICQYPADIVLAIKNIDKISGDDCYNYAMRYCLDASSVRFHYILHGFLRQLNGVSMEDWHRDGWADNLSWLDYDYDKNRVDNEIKRIKTLIALED